MALLQNATQMAPWNWKAEQRSKNSTGCGSGNTVTMAAAAPSPITNGIIYCVLGYLSAATVSVAVIAQPITTATRSDSDYASANDCNVTACGCIATMPPWSIDSNYPKIRHE